MKTLYLHVGTPKTGTSALQHFCARNRKILSEKGVCYPDLGYRFAGIGKHRNAHFLSYRVYLEKKKRDYDEEKRIRTEGLQKLDEQFQEYSTVVLSDEHIWNEPEMNTEFLSKLVEHYKAMDVTLKIIVYLRRQDQVVQSYWAQKVKETSTITFEKYIEKKKYEYFRLDYATRLQEFADAVGKENVIVRCYEKQQYEGEEKSIISDFLNIFGLKITDEYREIDKIRNTSLDGPYLEVKRLLNTLPQFKLKKSSVVELLSEQQGIDYAESKPGGKKSYFTPESEKAFMQAYEQENIKVSKEYLQRPDGQLFYESYVDELEEGKSATGYSSKELVQICGNVLTRLEEKYDVLLEEQKRRNQGNVIQRFARRCKRKISSRS